MNGVSILICTHNRAALLKHCLESFCHQTRMPENIEFLVVANACSDATEETVKAFQQQLPNLAIVHEPRVGLSIARNTGAAHAQFDWICYMDDDAKAHPDFIEKLLQNINSNKYDGFGGMFYPWYLQPKPQWLPEVFGRMNLLRDDAGPLPNGTHVAGGISAFKKALVLQVGGFPENIGMRGNTIGYGEENEMQQRMQDAGAIIGFDPDWKMDHLVADYKMKTQWHLQRAFAKGRDSMLNQAPATFLQKVIWRVKAILMPPYLWLKLFPKLLLDKQYYRQNFWIDSMSYSHKLFGKLSA